MTITTVETVKGKVWAITPPLSIILTLEDGKNQQFKIPEDQKFEVDGQMVDAFAIRKGMIITATKITEQPAVEVTQTKTVTGGQRLRPPQPRRPRECTGPGRGGERRGGAGSSSRTSCSTSSSARGREWLAVVGDLVAGSSSVGCHHLVVYEPEEPLGLMIVKRTSRGSPVSCGRLLGLEVIATGASDCPRPACRDLPARTSDRQTESHPGPLLHLPLACNRAILAAGISAFVGSKIGQSAG